MPVLKAGRHWNPLQNFFFFTPPGPRISILVSVLLESSPGASLGRSARCENRREDTEGSAERDESRPLFVRDTTISAVADFYSICLKTKIH